MFRQRPRPSCSPCSRVVLITACVVACECLVSAQAFLPPSGEGNVTVVYQDSLADGHLDLNGNRMPGASCCDPVRTHSIGWDVEFGVHDRLAFNLSLPYISSRYGGPYPHPVDVEGQPSEMDNGTYHGTFQDFHIGMRFNLKARPVSVTPFAEVIIPSHHYPSLAHSAPGKDLRALIVGGSVGKFLDAVLPGLFFQTQVSYALVQEIVGIRPNRSRVDTEVGYFITPRLAVRFLETYQVTHHGLDSVLFAGPNSVALIHGHPEIAYTTEHRRNHDRLQRSNFFNLGGGVGFALNDSVEIFAAAARTVWGESVHPLRGLSVGTNLHFRTRPGTPRIHPDSRHVVIRDVPSGKNHSGDTPAVP
jgi:hypothetical protein